MIILLRDIGTYFLLEFILFSIIKPTKDKMINWRKKMKRLKQVQITYKHKNKKEIISANRLQQLLAVPLFRKQIKNYRYIG